MRTLAGVIFALAALATLSPASAAKARLVYKVDSASASIENHHLVIIARGAVRSGGWSNPRLRLRDLHIPESDTVVYEFIATPPPTRKMVVQAILPVEASLRARLPRYGAVQVRLVSETNSIVTPIDFHPPK